MLLYANATVTSVQVFGLHSLKWPLEAVFTSKSISRFLDPPFTPINVLVFSLRTY